MINTKIIFSMTEGDARSFALFKGWQEDGVIELEDFIKSSIEDSSRAILDEWKAHEKEKAIAHASDVFEEVFDQKIEEGLSVNVE